MWQSDRTLCYVPHCSIIMFTEGHSWGQSGARRQVETMFLLMWTIQGSQVWVGFMWHVWERGENKEVLAGLRVVGLEQKEERSDCRLKMCSRPHNRWKGWLLWMDQLVKSVSALLLPHTQDIFCRPNYACMNRRQKEEKNLSLFVWKKTKTGRRLKIKQKWKVYPIHVIN
jgi:hypothetical protein